MSLKRFRSKLEEEELISTDTPGMVFKKDGKYFTDVTYSKEVDKSIVEENKIVAIQFKTPDTPHRV